jgi:carboxypeptidase C (cathepsin A)
VAADSCTRSLDNKDPDGPQNSLSAPIPEPVSFSRERSSEFSGETVRYRAVAGETYIRNEKAAPVASFFTVAYLKSDVENPSTRPVTFVFNGGPGSSAQWLHMGAFGPKRVEIPSEPNNVGAPPYAIVDNPLCFLDVSDLVFIDPIGTGYSRALSGKEDKDYWGLLEDARAVAEFIQTWITDQRRWNSPKYLVGESYGTVRAALVSEELNKRYIVLNGIVLISAVLDYQNSRPRAEDGGILSYASFLPTFAATAWYHSKVDRKGRTLGSFLDEVRTFACTRYADALIANHRLGKSERAHIVSRVAAYTGLKESYVDRSKLRIPVGRFFKELLRDQGLVIGRLDGRYTSLESENAGEFPESDPTFDAIGSAFTAAVNIHLSELGVRMQRPYLPMRDIENWNWLMQDKAPSGGGYINVVPHLGRAMRHNKDLRVLVASGYYDLATPFFGAENALSQDGVAHERISYTYYEVGHMIFLHELSRVRLLTEVRQFIQAGVSPAQSAWMRESPLKSPLNEGSND